MAKGENVEATATSEAPKRRRAQGPRQNKPVHILFRVTDANGQPIEGASLEIVLASKDTNAVIDAMDANKDLTRVKVEV